ncbi:photosynthetic NDH subunit of subcomplex B 3, chloroplastic-like [Hordeum vulgare subsp. vulgare]|uniref:photosynthetic NDH subunit of subcomplex B 3, chloroplastic-like n=1 Tax=Hordeum vulgare subsp. vulgare TaxID=112509 RepID=UPI001D1A48FD|nr:photosynthetic NDH subunit of subcomplex B 3, chloroplastic-like [Hordeum vulgare subsp. vulgare]
MFSEERRHGGSRRRARQIQSREAAHDGRRDGWARGLRLGFSGRGNGRHGDVVAWGAACGGAAAARELERRGDTREEGLGGASGGGGDPHRRAPAPPRPQIELEFLGPKPGTDGSYPVDRSAAVNSDKLLRDIMVENKIELYATYRKLMNCSGGGSCGTCTVEIIDGKELLSPRTDAENRYLKKKPESWRLTCQTIVGNKENSGKA